MDVEVLMSTYNGGKYIKEQIDSIRRQTIPVHITVRDDGSNDSTLKILDKYQNINVIKGENKGATESFLTLIDLAPDADYYAFSDQDDVWDQDKLDKAISALKKYEEEPTIYSGNTRLVDCDLSFIKCEKLYPKTTLVSAMIKNYATGCTVVFNKKLMCELKKYHPVNIPFHDWWVNLVCLSIGGISLYDVEPHMNYRQHANNVVSGNDSQWKKWTSRIKKFNKPYHRDNMARQLLDHYSIGNNEKEILEVLANKDTNNMRIFKNGTGNKIDDLLFQLCFLLRKI